MCAAGRRAVVSFASYSRSTATCVEEWGDVFREGVLRERFMPLPSASASCCC